MKYIGFNHDEEPKQSTNNYSKLRPHACCSGLGEIP
jgi:hypothetical protein